jgi:hypothetical protein
MRGGAIARRVEIASWLGIASCARSYDGNPIRS